MTKPTNSKCSPVPLIMGGVVVVLESVKELAIHLFQELIRFSEAMPTPSVQAALGSRLNPGWLLVLPSNLEKTREILASAETFCELLTWQSFVGQG